MAGIAVAVASPGYCSSKVLPFRPNTPCHRGLVSFTRRFHARLTRTSKNCVIVCSASSAAGNAGSWRSENDENPYEVLGVNPIEGFDAMKAAYKRRKKDAEIKGDEMALARLERAYDKIMMSQLTNRKKGLAFGSFQVSKDIKYADKQPIVPWGPRFSKSSSKDLKINLAISTVFFLWIFIKRAAEYKPLQFLGFAYVYRMFEKLKSSEPDAPVTLNEEGEDEGRGLRMGKRLLRSLALVFSCIALASLGYTGLLNLIEYLGQYIPLFLFNNQELIITASSAIMLYIMASFYR
ncbi:chloroplast J-like domain 1 [Wolffia australiana]